MIETKNPALAPTIAGLTSKTNQFNNSKLTPRLHRLARALLTKPQTVRDLIDATKSNNPAEYIRQLRTSYGLSIPCDRVKYITYDGESSWYGLYRLSDADKEKLQAVLPLRSL